MAGEGPVAPLGTPTRAAVRESDGGRGPGQALLIRTPGRRQLCVRLMAGEGPVRTTQNLPDTRSCRESLRWRERRPCRGHLGPRRAQLCVSLMAPRVARSGHLQFFSVASGDDAGLGSHRHPSSEILTASAFFSGLTSFSERPPPVEQVACCGPSRRAGAPEVEFGGRRPPSVIVCFDQLTCGRRPRAVGRQRGRRWLMSISARQPMPVPPRGLRPIRPGRRRRGETRERARVTARAEARAGAT